MSLKVFFSAWPEVGHALAAFVIVTLGAIAGAAGHFATAVSAFYFGREVAQAKIWTTGKFAKPITDWSFNPRGPIQAAVPAVVASLTVWLWLWVL